ncbi:MULTISPECIES: lytic transglycosylase domain-containing protein [Streptomyces]|uniref:Lytic transglycosylase domain-containing protein n=1 Tax=Streptomyces edwardsiae TaxID=3075527 RepID=A0ABU2PUZ0_9ACTN|nr:lytic transglycosylase domain-containing protein [Streptomyces sp. DSM 41636]MDT0395105.1 lytic transglycosylase domain-containing protein [Streptomyces sp. DSM 41636]
MSAGTGGGGEGGTSTAVRNTIAAGTGCGCLLSPLALLGALVVIVIIGGFGVLLAPLIALILLFSGGGDGSAGPEDADEVIAVFNGDGGGELEASTVPEDLVDPIEEAGGLCDAVGPVVIASQIERESAFDGTLVGENGEKGVSQLPPEIFDEYGEDEDDNDETSALDAADSILAQGRYLCHLAEEAQRMIDANEATGNVLDLALAGYHVGMDAVRAAEGVPQTNEAQGYVLAIRAQFAKYAGVAAPPPGATPGVTPGADPSPSGTPSAEQESGGQQP